MLPTKKMALGGSGEPPPRSTTGYKSTTWFLLLAKKENIWKIRLYGTVKWTQQTWNIYALGITDWLFRWLPTQDFWYNSIPSIFSSGGVVLASRDGKTVCENTLGARLDVVFRKKLPEVLFLKVILLSFIFILLFLPILLFPSSYSKCHESGACFSSLCVREYVVTFLWLQLPCIYLFCPSFGNRHSWLTYFCLPI